VQVGPHQTLGGQTMAAGAIEAKKAPAIAHIAFELEGGTGIGIIPEWREQHHQAEQQYGEPRHQGE